MESWSDLRFFSKKNITIVLYINHYSVSCMFYLQMYSQQTQNKNLISLMMAIMYLRVEIIHHKKDKSFSLSYWHPIDWILKVLNLKFEDITTKGPRNRMPMNLLKMHLETTNQWFEC